MKQKTRKCLKNEICNQENSKFSVTHLLVQLKINTFIQLFKKINFKSI